MRNQDIRFTWLVILAGMILWLGTAYAAECKPYNEIITQTPGTNYIQIIGQHTPESLAQCKLDWKQRQEAGRGIVAEEIERAHEVNIEAAKIEVLGRLEKLSATTINVKSSASGGNNTTTAESTNTITNDLRSTQTVR